MKRILLYYRSDGVVVENLERKDYIAIKYRTSTLSTDRLSGAVTQSYQYDELMGFLMIEEYLYFVLIQEKEVACKLNGNTIFIVKNIELMPALHPDDWKSASSSQKTSKELKATLLEFSLYYSYDLDITHSLQTSNNPLPDARFFWNESLIDPFRKGFEQWIVVFMDGFIKSFRIGTSSDPIYYTLISRRDKSRAGMRFSSRGSDMSGNVSNFVETEQIINSNNCITSFVQTRGNIPLVWKTKETDVLKPKMKFVFNPKQNDVIKNHFNSQKMLYGDITILNLINNRGPEKILHDMFQYYVAVNDVDAKYVAFDFHKICSGNKFQFVETLVDSIEDDLLKDGFYWVNDGVCNKQQNGVVRTNCIDCLDRTNVVQTVVAKRLLRQQLIAVGQMDFTLPLEALISVPELSELMNVWADHANQMSFRYTQTVAMKTDFTRKGKREFKGILSDGMISLQRTFISVKTDQYAKPQESLDLVLGKTYYGTPSFLKECKNVGLCIANAYKRGLYSKAAVEIPIHIHVNLTLYSEYNVTTHRMRSVFIKDIVHCEMCDDDPRNVVLLTAKDSLPTLLLLPSVQESYSFVLAINSCNKRGGVLKRNRGLSFSNVQITKTINISLLQWKMDGIITFPTQKEISELVSSIQGSIVDIVLYNCICKDKTYDLINDPTPATILFEKISKELKTIGPYETLVVHEDATIAHCVFVLEETMKDILCLQVSRLYTGKKKRIGDAILFDVNETSIGFVAIETSNELTEAIYTKNGKHLDTDVYYLYFITNQKQMSCNILLNQCELIQQSENGCCAYHRNIWKYMSAQTKTPLTYPSITPNNFSNSIKHSCINFSMNYFDFPKNSSSRVEVFITKFVACDEFAFEGKQLTLVLVSHCLKDVEKFSFPLVDGKFDVSNISFKLNRFPHNHLELGVIRVVLTDNTLEVVGVLPLTVVTSKKHICTCTFYSDGSYFGEATVEMQSKEQRGLFLGKEDQILFESP